MYIYYITLAFRSLQKHTVFTLINVLGLSLGMTAFVLITQYVTFETGFNSFHDNAPSLYRVLNEKPDGEFDVHTAPGFAPMAGQKIAGVEQYCRIADGANLGTGVVSFDNARHGVQSFREKSFIYADENFFGFFTFPTLSGDVLSLKNPNTVAFSRSASKKYFGEESALGKIITLNNQFGTTLYTVGLVYEDMPQYSDLRYDLVFSIQTLYATANLHGNEAWASMDGTGSQWLFTFIKLKEGARMDIVSQQYTELQHQINPDDKNTVRLQPVLDMHLGDSLGDTLPTFGSLRFIYILTGIAALIVIIAWFNYINLSTAGALKRAKEIGIRKVTGASRAELIRQLLGESILLNSLAFALAVILVSVLQVPYYNLIGKEIPLSILNYSDFWIKAIIAFIAGTLASGTYTAFILSAYNPSKVLKGVFSKSAKGIFIRKSLVVAQFSVSLIMIASTIILFQQWKYMEGKNLGIEAEQLMVIREAEVQQDDTFEQRSTAFEDGIRSASFIQAFCRSGNVPTDGFNFSTAGITRPLAIPGTEKINYDIITIDDRFLDTYELPLKAGQNFTREMCTGPWNDMKHVILNEKACAELGFSSPAESIGEKIKWDNREFVVQGVVKNYHHLSVQYAIGPIVFLPSLKGGHYTVKLTTDNIAGQVEKLEQLYKANFPGNPFEFEFLDDSFDSMYHAERQYSIFFSLASGLAIFIGCLGLFGLAAYSVEQRTKEIGIRKVLGSSSAQITGLFLWDFLALIMIAFIIAVPISWWSMAQWLQSFAYHTTISWWVFAIAGLGTFLVALITVGTQALKSAVSNPVNSLRSE